MERLKVIAEYHNTLVEVYNEENLVCLEDNQFVLKGKQILEWFYNVTYNASVTNKLSKREKIIDDLILYSGEIMHLTGQLFLLKPYLNNPIAESNPMDYGKIIYPNNLTHSTKKYFMYADFCFERIYSYWSRIGDLIHMFFPNSLSHRDVYFGKVIGIIPPEFHHLGGYTWLKNFNENGYRLVNSKRKIIVHYNSSITNLNEAFLDAVTDRQKIEELIRERDSIPYFMKNQINLTLDGFFETLTMLEEINKSLFSRV